MFTIKEIKEIIYHELGHVLVYLLANANEETYLASIKFVSIGCRNNVVVPSENLYYYEIGKSSVHIAENSINIKRTLCWIILQFSGCLFESYYENSEFYKCFCSKKESSGQKDYDNLFYFRHYSSIKFSDEDFERLKSKYTQFLENNHIYEKMCSYLEDLLGVFGSNPAVLFAGEDLEILVDQITERVLNEKTISAFQELITQEERYYL